mmetsp:Transcript_2556/g.9683  ORF Transcript_2556/g.9683 Transcript_2556/m.9683 type:complete len:109 (-) Transcript_2556:96-422(-)
MFFIFFGGPIEEVFEKGGKHASCVLCGEVDSCTALRIFRRPNIFKVASGRSFLAFKSHLKSRQRETPSSTKRFIRIEEDNHVSNGIISLPHYSGMRANGSHVGSASVA